MNISGIALVEHSEQRTTFIIVHDNKSPGEQHAALLTVSGRDKSRYTPLDWDGSDIPVDLEAITSVPGDSTSFMALTSAGRVFHIRLAPEHNSVDVIQSFDLPSIPADSDFEGIALQVVDGLLLVTWAERGLDAKPATLFWSRFDLRSHTFSQVGYAAVRVPYPTANVRHISDVKVDPNGAVFVSAAANPGNDGPFVSAVYDIGTFAVKDTGQVVFKPAASLTPLRQFSNHKVEALELIPGESGGRAFGSDDENSGSAICLDWSR
jgi:hypothetical protein